MGFPCLEEILAVLGARGPKIWILATVIPQRHVYQRNHVVLCIIHGRRKLRLTCGLVWEKRWDRTKSQKFDKRLPRGGATAQRTPNFFGRSNVLPNVVTLPNLVLIGWRVFVPQGVEIARFLCLAERIKQQCCSLTCSAVIAVCPTLVGYLVETSGLLVVNPRYSQ